MGHRISPSNGWIIYLSPSAILRPAWRQHQGQALRMLRNLEAAGRGRTTEIFASMLIKMNTYHAIYEELS
jgi:hypothetical protein